MDDNFARQLEKYADLIVEVGLNVQPGQRLLVTEPMSNGARGVPIESAPFIRQVAAKAYGRGAKLVDALWDDPQLELVRYRQAPPESFDQFSAWRAQARMDTFMAADALLSVTARDPDLLKEQDPERVSALYQSAMRHLEPANRFNSRTNWTVVAAATAGWAARVFPELAAQEQERHLWQAIFDACRVGEADPVAAWRSHIAHLQARSGALNDKSYAALHFTGPGTDLTVGLADGHKWKSASNTTEGGIPFVANVPTEEIYTMPHREQAEGYVTATKPLFFGGALVKEFRLTFSAGQVVDVQAQAGEAVLRRVLATDEGARRLGEVALVPHSSPISQSGLLFYATLFDENAAHHLALGRAYRSTLRDGQALSDEAFASRGGNRSAIHVDFMIGSGAVDVDGVGDDGQVEPIMRQGEWAFDL